MAALLDAVLAVELDLALDVALAVELGLALDVALDVELDVVLAALDASGVKLVAWLSTLAAVESNAFCPPTTFAVVAYELASCTMESGL